MLFFSHVLGGMASAGRGLFVGTWLGAVFEAFQIKVAELKSEAMLAEKEMKMVEVRYNSGATAVQQTIVYRAVLRHLFFKRRMLYIRRSPRIVQQRWYPFAIVRAICITWYFTPNTRFGSC